VMVAFAVGHGVRALAGLLLALSAVGSLLAGLWYGTWDWHASAHRRVAALLLSLPAPPLPFPPPPPRPPLAAAAPPARGRGFAALIAGFTLTERLLPQSVLTEGFAWLDAATGIGFAAGSTAGGLAADAAGPRPAFLLAAAAALLAAAIATLGRRSLTSPVTT